MGENENYEWLLEPFTVTEDVDRMLGDHSNTDGTYEILETLDNGDKIAKLKPEVAKELAQSHSLFISEEYANKYEAEANANMVSKVKEALNEMEINPEDYEISSEIHEDRMGNHGMYVEISRNGESEVIEPHGYYMQDDGHGALEAMESPGYEWLVWLAHYESPFYDEGFKEAYIQDYTMNTFKNLAEQESDFLVNNENDLLDAIEGLNE